MIAALAFALWICVGVIVALVFCLALTVRKLEQTRAVLASTQALSVWSNSRQQARA